MPAIRIFRHYLPLQFVLLAFIELVLFVLSFHAAVLLRFSSDPEAVAQFVGPVWPKSVTFALVMLLSMIGLGLYDRMSGAWEGRSAMVLRILFCFLLAIFPLTFIFYVFPSLSLWRGPMLLALIISLLAVVTVRLFFIRMVNEQIFKRRILVLGAGNNACQIRKMENKPPLQGIVVTGYVHMSRDHDVVEGDRIIMADRPLREIVKEYQIDEMVVAVDDRRKTLPVHEILDCKMDGVSVVDMLTFFERETGKVRLELMHPSWLFLSDGFQISNTSILLKRALDIVVSLTLLPVFVPVMLIVVMAIWIESRGRGGVIYKQARVGANNQEFEIYKFRSMTVNAEHDGVPQWARKNDSRVTWVGAIIRKVRLDELPQLFNVLKGDMSFVGPRPERPEFVRQLEERYPYYRERHRMRPGLTGWAQIRYNYGDTMEDAFEKLQYDLYYVKNCSIFLDLLIIVHTVQVVLMGKGAH